MEFTNTLAGSSAFADDESTPHVLTGREASTEPPSRHNARWTPARHARYDYVLHVVSLTLGTLTLCAYIFDLAKSASFHVGVPVGITVVDTMSIAFLAINNAYSLVYFVTGMKTRIFQGDLSRKWPICLDLMLHCTLIGMADTTLSMRSSNGKGCDKNRAVGGCLPSRRALMITAGVVLILVGVAAQMRFGCAMHAISERKKLEKAARRELAHDEAGLTLGNDMRLSASDR